MLCVKKLHYIYDSMIVKKTSIMPAIILCEIDIHYIKGKRNMMV